MKKVYLLLNLSILFTVSTIAQTDYLYIKGPMYVGLDLGFSQHQYLPIGFHIGSGSMQYGVTVGLPVNKGVKGEYYSNINWDEYPEDIIAEGEYFTPFTFDVGYNVYGGLVIGAGLGYAYKTHYRNMFDELHILGYNGRYNISVRGDGEMEYKAFVSYYIPSERTASLYLKGYYSNIMGIGLSLGFSI